MFNTPDMGLLVWEQGKDPYSHQQLQGNWQVVNDHDHSPGKGRLINASGIAPGAIGHALLADNSVGENNIQDNAVDTDDIQDGAVTASKLAPGAASGAIGPGTITHSMLDPNLMPLGTVWLWWRQSGSAVPGGGWEVMDGRPWSTITNNLGPGGAALTTGNIPDMRGMFAQGADPVGSAGPGIGVVGGQNSIDLTHVHSVPPHTHPIVADGAHTHTWVGGKDLGIRRNSFVNGLTINDHSGTQRQNTYWSFYINGFESTLYYREANGFGDGSGPQIQDFGSIPMDPSPNHDHGGNTDFSTLGVTGTNLGLASLVPRNVGMLYIMLVR